MAKAANHPHLNYGGQGTIHENAQSNLHDVLSRCGSGKELIGRGFAEDVQLAAQLNVSSTAPVLSDGAYKSG